MIGTAEKLLCKNKLFDDYVISQEEQNELINRYNNGETDLRDKIILSYYPFVISVINKYCKYIKLSENDDLISIGLMALVKAFDKFDRNGTVKFSTFASVCIKRDVWYYLRKNKKYYQLISLDEEAFKNDEDNPMERIELIEATGEESDPINYVERNNLIGYILDQIDKLPEFDKKVLKMRYDLSSDVLMNQGAVAKKLGTSQSYISRVEKRALETIRKKVAVR